LNSFTGGASKSAVMKKSFLCSILAITLAATGATAMAHERYSEGGWHYRGREVSRCNEPEVYYDRFGNRVFIARTPRYVAPVEEHCYRPPVVVPECRRPQIRFEVPFPGPLRFLFPR
jgi:hypothetical protein